MKQPKILIDGVIHKVASIWWDEDGSISHITYHFKETVETVFGSQEFFEIILIKEEKKNEPATKN